MRLALGLVSVLALTAGLTSCKAPSKAVQSGDAMQLNHSNSKEMTGFDRTVARAEAALEQAMASPVTIPTPKDPGGGYTHETHKGNFALIYDAAQLYQLTGEKKYAIRPRKSNLRAACSGRT